MKRLIFPLILVCACLLTSAKVTKPDFAYPATVSKDARADIEQSIVKHDSKLALNALCRYFASASLIDRDSIPAVIKVAESVATHFTEDMDYGLFPALIANFYTFQYIGQRYIYDQRQLPLETYPEDINEWSGAMFRNKIRELCEKSYSQPELLRQCKTKDYTQVIAIDKIAMEYYATLLDFVWQNALNLYETSNDDASAETLTAQLSKVDKSIGEAPYILWRTKCLNGKEDEYKQLKDLYTENQDSKYAGLILESLHDRLITTDISKLSWYCRSIETYLKKFPKTPFKDILNYYYSRIIAPKINVDFDAYVPLGSPVQLKVRVNNVNSYSIKVYRKGNGIDSESSINVSKLTGLTPIDVITMTQTSTAPFVTDTILTYNAEIPGDYIFVPNAKDLTVQDNVNMCKVVQTYPISILCETLSMVALVDAATGRPVKDCPANVSDRLGDGNTLIAKSQTDSMGVAVFAQQQQSVWNQKLTFDTNNVKYAYNGTWLRHIDATENGGPNINIFTDRSIYHPGETVQVLAICTECGSNCPDGIVLQNRLLTIILYNANHQKVGETKAETDAMGRVTTEFELPVDGLTGTFRIAVQDQSDVRGRQFANIMVSDYKMPDFKIVDIICTNDTPAKGDVTISGKAQSYSGMPMAKTQINVVVTEYSWWRYSNGNVVCAAYGETDEDGNFSIVIKGDELKTSHAGMFLASISATSLSGSSVTESTTFMLGKKYLIEGNTRWGNIDGRLPFKPDVKIVDSKGEIVNIPLYWRLVTNYGQKDEKVIADGQYTGTIDLTAITPGLYTLVFYTQDKEIADNHISTLTIYNTDTDIVPGTDALWVKGNETFKTATADTAVSASIVYGVTESSYLYRMVTDDEHIIKFDLIETDKGYHTFDLEIPAGKEYVNINLFTLKDCRTCTKQIQVRREVDRSLIIESSSFRDNLMPGSQETWSIKIRQSNPAITSTGEYAVVLDMYNQALDALYPHHQRLNFPRFSRQIPVYVTSPVLYSNSNLIDGKYIPWRLSPVMEDPSFQYIELENRDFIYYTATSARPMLRTLAKPAAVSDMCDAAEVESAVDCDYADDEGSAPAGANAVVAEDSVPAEDPEAMTEHFDYRDSYVPLAIWAPKLTTDGEGNLAYTFTVPNANTTWRLNAAAWNSALQSGNLTRDFVASKPLMVQPNLPRFLRSGDKVVIESLVMNKTEETQTVTTTVEIFNPYTSKVISSRQFKSTIDPMQQTSVKIDLEADGNLEAIGYRVRTTNGTYSDGEQSAIPILSSEAQLIETTPFYLNPGEKTYTTRLVKDKGARLTLTFCENPVWTVVSALPGLREDIAEYANSAAAALFSAYVAKGILTDNPEIGTALRAWRDNPNDSALVSNLTKNENLKIAMLNATPWVMAAQSDQQRLSRLALLFDNDEIDSSISKAIHILKKLQKSDGGWSWSDWSGESSIWVTSNVLAMLGELKSYGWLPESGELSGMIRRALKYYDKTVKDTDLDYCLIRPLFTDVAISANGQKVIRNTIAEIKRDWKKYNNPEAKARAAEALWLNNEEELAKTLLASLTEFGVYTKDQGLKFPNVNSIYSYAMILDAYAMILPNSKEVDGLRQQLIVRKQATDWGSAVVTSEVVASILSSGSKWTVDATGAVVKAGNVTVSPHTAVETATGSFTADLSAYRGKELTITTTGTGPAYGAVYSQFSRAINEVKAYGIDDLTIEKHLFVRRGTAWETAQTLKVGDRVKVQLTIHNKRNMNYVEVIDERPAAFSPVNQLPGWEWSEGAGFYRENRDSQTNLHIVNLRPGTYLLSYEMDVTVAGTFYSGVATIQSQYAPELTAHSSGAILNVASEDK